MFSDRLEQCVLHNRAALMDALIVDEKSRVIWTMICGNFAHLESVARMLDDHRSVVLSDSNYDRYRMGGMEVYGCNLRSCGFETYPNAATMLIYQRRLFEPKFPGQTELWSVTPHEESVSNKIWDGVKSLSPICLLDEWRTPIMEELVIPGRSGIIAGDARRGNSFIIKCSSALWITSVSFARGGRRRFVLAVAAMIREGRLRLPSDMETAAASAIVPARHRKRDFALRVGYQGAPTGARKSSDIELSDIPAG